MNSRKVKTGLTLRPQVSISKGLGDQPNVNLVFSQYKMPARRNTAQYYDVKSKKPAGKRQGVLKLGQLTAPASGPGAFRLSAVRLGAVFSLMLAAMVAGLTLMRRSNRTD